jgi:cell division protein FtsZ
MQARSRASRSCRSTVDSLITIPNEKLLTVLGREHHLLDAFRAANDVLLGAVQGIADLIVRPGLINVDFADVRTVMSEMGMAMMGTGVARGDRARDGGGRGRDQQPAAGGHQPAGRRGILVNITAGPDLTMREFDEVGRTRNRGVRFSNDATVVIGTVLDHGTCRTRCASPWWPPASWQFCCSCGIFAPVCYPVRPPGRSKNKQSGSGAAA